MWFLLFRVCLLCVFLLFGFCLTTLHLHMFSDTQRQYKTSERDGPFRTTATYKSMKFLEHGRSEEAEGITTIRERKPCVDICLSRCNYYGFSDSQRHNKTMEHKDPFITKETKLHNTRYKSSRTEANDCHIVIHESTWIQPQRGTCRKLYSNARV